MGQLQIRRVGKRSYNRPKYGDERDEKGHTHHIQPDMGVCRQLGLGAAADACNKGCDTGADIGTEHDGYPCMEINRTSNQKPHRHACHNGT